MQWQRDIQYFFLRMNFPVDTSVSNNQATIGLQWLKIAHVIDHLANVEANHEEFFDRQLQLNAIEWSDLKIYE